MDVDTPAASKKKLDKSDSPPDNSAIKHEVKKSDKKPDPEDPKPRIVLTFRSEKPGAKSSTMKIVPTEEKHEEVSPRRSSRTRAQRWDSDEENEALISPKKTSRPVSENDEASDSSAKRPTRCRSKEFDNVLANAITRKEKSYIEAPVPTRLSRRIKPTAKVLANEELRIGLESQNNARLGIQQEKSADEGVRTRRSVRSTRQAAADVVPVDKDAVELGEENQSQVMKLKHLCELGLKAKSSDDLEDDSRGEEGETEDSEAIEIEDEGEEDEEIDDDTEVISKLLEADADSISDSDEDFLCSEDTSQSEVPRRSARRSRKSQGVYERDIAFEREFEMGDDDESAPRRRSSRPKRKVPLQNYEDIVGSYLPQHKKSRPTPTPLQEDTAPIDAEVEDVDEPAGADDGSEAACPENQSQVIATCFCEDDSNVHAAPSELIEPVFCQAIESVDGIRVGCSHGALKASEGSYAAMLRAGPRAPYVLACALHAAQLRRHMGCPACGLFCTQGVFYQCSKGHLFHLECGVPYNDSKSKAGCPHCGVYSYMWQPANTDCARVRVDMNCSNKRIFLPDQREQCTPAYLGFSTLQPSQLDQGPVIPADLLPSPPIDLKRMCEKRPDDYEELLNGSPLETLCEAIIAGETADQLIPKIMCCISLNSLLPSGVSCAHVAARRAHLAALYLLQYAGADLNVTDVGLRTPLMTAVIALLDKDQKSSKKSKTITDNSTEDVEVDQSKEELSDKEEKDGDVEGRKRDKEIGKGSDEDLMKVIRYLVAAGCDVNIPGPDGMTALHMSAQHGGASVCGALLGSAGARTEPRDHGGWTPLVWAAENGHAEVVRLLLSEGADAEATDSEGNAVIHWCALAGAAHSLQLLLDAAPDAVAALNAHIDTPLHVAARQGHYACVVILLARGARTDVENSAGELPVEVCSGHTQSAISLNMQMSLAAKDKLIRRRLLASDISRGRELHPVPCVNDVDDAPLPDDFTYVTAHVTPRSVYLDTTTQSMQGCTCKNGDCSSSTCECCVLGVRRWFARGRLQPGFPYRDPPMLFECNQTCGCNAKKCGNSVITSACQRGSVFVRACVFRCGGARGWGLRASAGVPRGAPVATYCGELLTLADADTRSADQYMFALDVKADLLEQCPDKVQLCVDAAQYGGAARFVNHSCRPNLAPVRVFTATRDLRLPTVALFATRDISSGEELTFDYGDKFWSVKSKWMRCECGEPDCRYPTRSGDEAET